jgi:hypothetical protein
MDDFNTDVPYFRNIGKFRLSKGGNALNLKIQGKFYSLPITDVKECIDNPEYVADIREYLPAKIIEAS